VLELEVAGVSPDRPSAVMATKTPVANQREAKFIEQTGRFIGV
jgi:hypothetical protein